MGRGEIGLALLGLGVVGSGVARLLRERGASFAEPVGCTLALKGVLVRDLSKARSPELPLDLLTTDAQALLADPGVHIVIEAMGGEHPALEFLEAALEQGKSVVTANKEVMAKHGDRLLRKAQRAGRALRFEASVGGGVPIVATLQEDLLANRITALRAIINGTTNYILSQMSLHGLDFSTALRQAQELGYAEPNPRDDVEGTDAVYKLAILAALAFGLVVQPTEIYAEGITKLTARDFRYARELGYAIKLLAIAKSHGEEVEVHVHPAFLPQETLLAQVQGPYNAIQIEGDLVGPLLLYGQGAGAQPTASALWADVLHLAADLARGSPSRPYSYREGHQSLRPFPELETRYYVRLAVADRPGVLAQIARIFGEHQISIASVIQKETDEDAQTAEIVIMTHLARERSVQRALALITELQAVREIGTMVRVER